MEDLAAKFHNWYNTGKVEVNYISLSDVSAFQLDNEIDAFVGFLNYVSYMLIPLQIFGYCQS